MTPGHPVPSWRVRERRARHDALLDAARAVFAERGYHAATVEEIAARAEVGKGTVYLHFPEGKAALLDAVVGAHLDDLRALVFRSFGEGEGPVRYRFWTLALAVATYFQERPELLRFHALELPHLYFDPDAGPTAGRIDRLVGDLFDVVAPALEAAGGTGAIPTRLAAYHLLVTLLGALTALSLTTDDAACAWGLVPSELADALTALAFDGVPLGPPP